MKKTTSLLITLIFLLSSTSVFCQQAQFDLINLQKLPKIILPLFYLDEQQILLASDTKMKVRIDSARLTPGQSASVEFPFPGKAVTVNLKPIVSARLGLPKEQAAWTGLIRNGGSVFVLRIGNAIEAQITRGTSIYRLRTIQGNSGVLEQYNVTDFPENFNDGVFVEEIGEDTNLESNPSCTDLPNLIDIMVLYTPQALDASGSTNAITNEIAFAVAQTNMAYNNSNVFHRLNLVFTGLASLSDPSADTNSNTLLNNLQNTSDEILDNIHNLRNKQGADLVSLIYEDNNLLSGCGRGFITEIADANTTDHFAFSVVKRSCASANLSFAHEVGHNLGAQHDRDNTSPRELDFNFGHIQPVPNNTDVLPWRTIMSYNSPCSESAGYDCQRLLQFSNPEVTISGDATGVPLSDPSPENNVQVFAQNDDSVARYRCGNSNNAKFVSQQVPSFMQALKQYSASVTMFNNGTTDWTAGDKLVSLAKGWTVAQVSIGRSVAPGERITVNIPLVALTPGYFSFQWSMSQNFGKRFGEATPRRRVQVLGNNGTNDTCDKLEQSLEVAEFRLREWQEMLKTAPSSQKSTIVAQIRRVNGEINAIKAQKQRTGCS